MNLKAKDLVAIAMMAAFIIALGSIPAIPLTFLPAPIILQNIGIMLAGVVLGARKGTIAVLLFLLLGIFIPAFGGGNNTIPVLMGVTAGYVISWIFVPALIGWGLSKVPTKNFPLSFAVIWLFGVLFIDTVGAIWMAQFLNKPLVPILISSLIYIPGDTLKALVATIISVRYQHLFRQFKN
ncbi:biotin transporter BioY [Streptococcus plurextorum]|uniref:biotin transporter BioY n=1 Tax=Streptococcus plurextorum TaxID=456876 RepID=UPI00040D5830|nr:biotin transporter BioY [Streptococcus plurextorum]